MTARGVADAAGLGQNRLFQAVAPFDLGYAITLVECDYGNTNASFCRESTLQVARLLQATPGAVDRHTRGPDRQSGASADGE